jgi:parallel beta-helix repeat protein
VLRNNQLRDNATIRLEEVSDALVEKNSVSDSDLGIFASKSCERVLITNNRFSRVTSEMVDEAGQWQAMLGRLKPYIGRPEPIADYHFDSIANNRFADDSGNHLTAAIHGGVSLDSQGHNAGAAKFDGTGYLQVDEPALFNAPDITVDLWVKPATLTGRRGLIAKRFEGSLCPLVIAQVGSAISFEAASSDDNWSFNFVGPSVLQIGKWTRVTVVAKQGEGVKLYLDGKLVVEKKDPDLRAQNDAPLIIGREAWGGDPANSGTPGFFSGEIDEVRIWARALSADEVAKNGG